MQNTSPFSTLIHSQAARYGERTAMMYRDYDENVWKNISWNRFSQCVRQVSNALLELGVDKKATEVVGRNLVRYIQWMLGNGRQEAIAHFASFFENATYPNANAFIMMDCREALALINQMIANL